MTTITTRVETAVSTMEQAADIAEQFSDPTRIEDVTTPKGSIETLAAISQSARNMAIAIDEDYRTRIDWIEQGVTNAESAITQVYHEIDSEMTRVSDLADAEIARYSTNVNTHIDSEINRVSDMADNEVQRYRTDVTEYIEESRTQAHTELNRVEGKVDEIAEEVSSTLHYSPAVFSAGAVFSDGKVYFSHADKTYTPATMPFTCAADIDTQISSGELCLLVRVASVGTAPDQIPTNSMLEVLPGRNLFMNGSFQINQRNIAKFNADSPSYLFTSDRWKLRTGGASGRGSFWLMPGYSNVLNQLSGRKNTRQAELSVSNSMDPVNGYARISQRIPNPEDILLPRSDMGTRKLVVSFKANAAVEKPHLKVRAVMYFGVGGGAISYHDAEAITVTTSWDSYQSVIELPNLQATNVNEGSFIEVEIWFAGGSGLGDGFDVLGTANKEVYIADIKAEVSDEDNPKATPFIQPEYRETEERCTDYFERLIDLDQTTVLGSGLAYEPSSPYETGALRCHVPFRPKRVNPTVTIKGDYEAMMGQGPLGIQSAATVESASFPSKFGSMYLRVIPTHTSVQGECSVLLMKAGAGNYIDIDAEL